MQVKLLVERRRVHRIAVRMLFVVARRLNAFCHRGRGACDGVCHPEVLQLHLLHTKLALRQRVAALYKCVQLRRQSLFSPLSRTLLPDVHRRSSPLVPYVLDAALSAPDAGASLSGCCKKRSALFLFSFFCSNLYCSGRPATSDSARKIFQSSRAMPGGVIAL